MTSNKWRKVLLVASIGLASFYVTVTAQAEECARVLGFEWGAKNTADPARVNNMADAMYAWSIYEPLVWLDNGFKPQPYLAESWSSNENATVWDFKLRDGVTFHDGSALSADDVVFTYQRLIDPETASPGAAELSFLEGAKIEAVEEHIVRFTLTAPNVELPTRLSTKFALIVPAGATHADIAMFPKGTGPFMTKKIVPEAPRATLQANSNYWQEGKPASPCLQLTAITEPMSRAAAVLSGQTDLLLVADPTTIGQMRESGAVDIVEAKGGTFMVMTMWVDDPPFDDIRVRKALKAVLDRQVVVDLALLGLGIPGNDNPIPPTSAFAYTNTAPKQNIQKAKTLLAEAGYSEGLSVQLHTGASELYPGMLTMVQAYKEMAAEAGIEIELVTSPSDSYWDEVWLKKPFVTSYWSPRPPSSAFATGYTCDASYNETHWCREDFDALLTKASSTVDTDKRIEMYKTAQQILADEGGVIVPAFASVGSAIRKGCKGFSPHVDINRMSFSALKCE